MPTIIWIFLSIIGTFVGVYISVLALKNVICLVRQCFCNIRIAPGYEVTGGRDSMVYVTGPRDMSPVMYPGVDPSRLVYHERGLSVFSRWWSFESWLLHIGITLATIVLLSAIGGALLYFSLRYLVHVCQ